MHEHYSRSVDSKASREHVVKLLKKIVSEEERSNYSIKTDPSTCNERSVPEYRDEYGYDCYAKSRSKSSDIRASCDSMIESDVSEDPEYLSNFPEKDSVSLNSKTFGTRTTKSFSKELGDAGAARRSNKTSNFVAIRSPSSSSSSQSRPISASSSRRSSQSSRSLTQARESYSFSKDRSPVVSVVRSSSNSAASAGRNRQYPSDYSYDYAIEDYENYNIFDRLHSESMEKNEEGRARREEIERKSIAYNRWRRGDDIRPARKISKEQGTKLYYYGMVHMVHMERKIAERAEELDIPFATRLNLEQMINYYYEMEKISGLKI